MKKELNILKLTTVLDYTFNTVSKKDERRIEQFLDTHEMYHDIVDELLDYCLDNSLTRAGFDQLFPVNRDLQRLVQRLEILNQQNEIVAVPALPSFYQRNIAPVLRLFSFLIIGKRTAQVLFTLMLMLNVPFLTTPDENGSIWNASVLKASSKSVIKKANIVTDFELKHLQIEMLEETTITTHLDQVVMPITLELRYITND